MNPALADCFLLPRLAQILLLLTLWSGLPAMAQGLEPAHGTWPLRKMPLPIPLQAGPKGQRPPVLEGHQQLLRSEQGEYFLAVGLAEADDEVDLPGAAAWAVEGDGSGRNCPVLRPVPLGRVHEADVQMLGPEQQALPEGCLDRLEGQCRSRDGALRISLRFEGRSRSRREAGRFFGESGSPPGPLVYTGRRWLEIEHVLSGIKAVFEENLNRSARFAKAEGHVVYLPELGAVLLLGLGSEPKGGASPLHCLRMP